MKKICMAALILLSGIMASCITKSSGTALGRNTETVYRLP
jgi:hypothetical protein